MILSEFLSGLNKILEQTLTDEQKAVEVCSLVEAWQRQTSQGELYCEAAEKHFREQINAVSEVLASNNKSLALLNRRLKLCTSGTSAALLLDVQIKELELEQKVLMKQKNDYEIKRRNHGSNQA